MGLTRRFQRLSLQTGSHNLALLKSRMRRTDTVINPCLITEVLSKSTQDHDRTDQFRDYRSIPELREYLRVNQSEVQVEHYVKNPDGSWLLRDYDASSRTIPLTCFQSENSLTGAIAISLADLYEGVQFDPPDPVQA